jgi:hypothetical protein
MVDNIALANSICDLLGGYDIQRLICIGAPEDEYWPEADYISKHLTKDMDVSQIEKLVKDTFDRYFGGVEIRQDPGSPKYANIAFEIKELLDAM